MRVQRCTHLPDPARDDGGYGASNVKVHAKQGGNARPVLLFID
jgi:hypothetical protein